MVSFYITNGVVSMEVESMACPEGGAHDYKLVKGQNVCQKCGHISSYQPMDIPALLKENKELRERNIALEDIVQKLVKELRPKPRHTAQD